jgi:hypothetical protein
MGLGNTRTYLLDYSVHVSTREPQPACTEALAIHSIITQSLACPIVAKAAETTSLSPGVALF